MTTYTVKRIDEDLDFGCEERTADCPIMAVVTLIASDGTVMKVREPDALLYERNIYKGDLVYRDADGRLAKAE